MGGPEVFILLLLLAFVLFIIHLIRYFGRRKSEKPKKNGTAKGLVRQFNSSTETVSNGYKSTKTVQVIRFMLERFDADGKELPNIAVEMKGQSFSGFIGEGHTVEIYDEVIPGRIVLPGYLYNHTSQSLVRIVKR
jgi:hypothetical protein